MKLQGVSQKRRLPSANHIELRERRVGTSPRKCSTLQMHVKVYRGSRSVKAQKNEPGLRDIHLIRQL